MTAPVLPPPEIPDDSPGLHVNVAFTTEVAVIEVVGEVDAYSLPILDSAVVSAFATHGRVLLDMDDVGFIDSSGLGLLIRSYRRADEIGGSILIREASPSVRRLLEVTGQSHRFLLEEAVG